MRRFSEVVTYWLVGHEVIDNDDKELYCYAVESFILSIAPVFLAIILGLIQGNVAYGIVIILPFMFIRKYSGGYHAKKLGSCLTCSILLLLVCIEISKHCIWGTYLIIMTVISSVSLVVFSPIDNDARRLNQEDSRYCKRRVCSIVVLTNVVIAILSLDNLSEYASCVCIGLILSGSLQIPCILKSIVKNDQKQADNVISRDKH